MLDYLGPVLALIGALAGLLGETRDKTKTGWKALTRSGRISLAVILVGFFLAIGTTFKQAARYRSLQATAAAEIEEGWQALVYPFTQMLWQINGSSVGYDDSALKSLLTPEVLAKMGALDICGEGPHYSGTWRAILGSSSRNGKAALETASTKFNSFLDDKLVVDVHNVLKCYCLSVLCDTEHYMQIIDMDAHWAGQPYPFRNLSNLRDAEEYLRALAALRADLARHLPRASAPPQ